jgi:CubicO group peptidase (beta-lactamase class C family)
MDQAMLKDLLEGAVARGDAAGVAAAVTDANGTLVEACAGVTARGGDAPVGPHTLFWIASMTKPVTSLAAMQLVEQGKLALDAPIGALLPELAAPQIIQPDSTLRLAVRPLTLRHLLTHTAGFSYAFASPAYVAYMAAHQVPASPGQLASLNMPLLFEPGERWEYGINTDWVGRAVEAASGMPLDEYVQAHIFARLGMSETMFWPHDAAPALRAATHQRQADGGLVALPLPAPRRPEFWSGGGGLYSTLSDYQKFMRVFLNGGAGLLRPETLAEMTRDQTPGLQAGYIPSANPALITGARLNEGTDTGWSLGFQYYRQPGPFGRGAGALSWAGLPNTYFWIDPAAHLAAIILMQTLPAGDLASLKLYAAFERLVYQAGR